MRVLMTMFGWADAGGGTIFPRQIAHELARRDHDVTVLYAALEPLPGRPPFAIRAHQEGAVRLLAVHNRPTPFLDDQAPAREVHAPEVVRLVQPLLGELRPDVVHFHNFLGLSGAIAEAVAAARVPSVFSPYNFWAVCPTLYLTLPDLVVCAGVAADGSNCLRCTKSTEPGAHYVARRDRLRELLTTHVGLCLPTSRSVRDVFLQNGYPAAWLRHVRAGSERAEHLWRDVGSTRVPGTQGPLRIGFLGSVLPIKGVHLLVAAAQALRGPFEVHVHGDTPAEYAAALRKLDARGVVRWHGRYGEDQLASVVRGLDLGVVPSICLDHSPMVVDELQAGRVPVLGADIGGIPEYVQQGAGELFAANDLASLAIALQRCVDDPTRVVEWQRRLHAPATFAAYVDELERVYEERSRPAR
jgi:glycosyltransferase involved in cell wall biosynthesis